MEVETVLSTSGESFAGNPLGSKEIIKSCVITGNGTMEWFFFSFLIRS